MGARFRRVAYVYTTLHDRPGEAFKLLARLAAGEVNLLAFGCMPVGPDRSQLTIFPDDLGRLARVAEKEGWVLDGPHTAILVQGDDRLGALAEVHERLYQVKVNVFASTGVTDGHGEFGYLIYVNPGDVGTALAALDSMR